MKFDIQSVLQQAQKMQEEMDRARNEARKKLVTADAGGGLVSVTMNGEHQIVSISINKDIIKADESDVLEDLIVAAVNKASIESQKLFEQEMNKVTDMLPKIPGLNL